MKYIKFDKNGKNAVQAPFKMKKDGKIIFGYNAPSNENMLFDDGYLKYDGDAPVYSLNYVDGVIVENDYTFEEAQQQKKTFSKLSIRRALRKMGKQDILDKMLLKRNTQFAKDWIDSTEINLDDDIFKNALKALDINEDLLQEVLKLIGE